MRCIKIIAGCIVLLICFGCANNQDNDIDTISVTQNEYPETKDILNYKYGITENLRKRMFLSEIARHYSIESNNDLDTITPVILVSFEERYKGFEVYCIGRTDPWALDVTNVSRLESQGRYIVAYALPDDSIMSKQEIIQFGINTHCPFLRVHEVSWFVFLSPDMHKYTIVKDVFSKEEACMKLEESLDHFMHLTI